MGLCNVKDWRAAILKYFVDPMSSLIIFADPHGLFDDEKLREVLRNRNVKVLVYQDPIVFRYVYEREYRDALERASLSLALVIKSMSFERVPFDILSKGLRVEIGLDRLFPKLSTTVLQCVRVEDFDAVASAYDQYSGADSESASLAFVLEAVFNIVIDHVNTKRDVLMAIASLHNTGKTMQAKITALLAMQLQRNNGLSDIPIDSIIASERAFLQYLQMEWENFIQDFYHQPHYVRDAAGDITQLELQCPLADNMMRPILNDLFAEGKLKPVVVSDKSQLPNWVSFGIEYDEEEQIRIRLLERIFHASEILNGFMNYKAWLQMARLFGEIKVKALTLKSGKDNEINEGLAALQAQIDRLFQEWALSSYDQMCSLPYLPKPVMVHHVPHYLANTRQDDKLALIVLDGMSVVQWQQIYERLEIHYEFDQEGVFAWLPTITSVSRQAIFCGERPTYYATSIDTTAKEAQHWQVFWNSHGVVKQYVDYVKITDQPLSYRPYNTSQPHNKVKGIVIDWIDQLVHSAIQGSRGLYEEMKLWLETGFFEEMIDTLLAEKYQIYITADHGNRECIGTGKLAEGVLAHTRGERARIYGSKTLRDQAAARYENGIPWDSAGLPANMHVLLSPVAGAFKALGERSISHGGIALEEVVVPFIKVSEKEGRRKRLYE